MIFEREFVLKVLTVQSWDPVARSPSSNGEKSKSVTCSAKKIEIYAEVKNFSWTNQSIFSGRSPFRTQKQLTRVAVQHRSVFPHAAAGSERQEAEAPAASGIAVECHKRRARLDVIAVGLRRSHADVGNPTLEIQTIPFKCKISADRISCSGPNSSEIGIFTERRHGMQVSPPFLEPLATNFCTLKF